MTAVADRLPAVDPPDLDQVDLDQAHTLAGKRIALVGFDPGAAAELAQVISDAEGFTRALSPLQVAPESEILRPFELILLDIEGAQGTDWLRSEHAAAAVTADRCIAVGQVSALTNLLNLAGSASVAFREYWTRSSGPEELLLRCKLALKRASQSAARRTPARQTPEGSMVVLADDDASVTSIVRRALERNGLTCELASTGRDALNLITKLKPCAAILDVNMPTIDGFEVLSRTRSTPELARTRIILLTGSEQESDVIRGFTLGADDYVSKPFNPMELTIRLMRVIGRLGA
jgi:DNA-binding response OmpR family regulator